MTTSTAVVRSCTDADLADLEAWAPTTKADLSHARWLERQRAGEISYFIAFVDGRIVGSAKVRWFEPRQPAHRPVPELFQLSVWPAEMRGRGVGSALIAEAERLARTKGIRSLTLGVDLENQAMRLYERLGYRDWGRGTCEDAYHVVAEDGSVVLQRDVITYMTKEL